jgi:hypothetical protein
MGSWWRIVRRSYWRRPKVLKITKEPILLKTPIVGDR